ncbi:MAG: hypothetical protein JXA99_03050 [Candidatus Lokiarchaeota archaeon]|nr:hypothetical protein [Candidatus Lokiarchaeota archaeon]
MTELNDDCINFFKHWFSGLKKGLKEIDKDARDKILKECGIACSHSFTANKFKEAYEESTDFNSFLDLISVKFNRGIIIEKINDTKIRFIYPKCYCDLVLLNLLKGPYLCDCSKFNLKENLEFVLGKSVDVQLETSILRGGNNCSLLVKFNK